MEKADAPRKRRAGLGQLAREHKLFSGFAGSVLVAAIAVVALIVGGHSGTTQTTTGAIHTTASVPPEKSNVAEGSPNEDGDGVPDAEDECPSEPGGLPNGCPTAASGLTLSEFVERSDNAYFEGGEREYLKTNNVELEQVTVGGITDPLGVAMEITGPEEAGAFTITTNGAFKTIEGRVGITTEPCSGGSVAYVDIRNSEGEPLWPTGGKLQRIRRSAIPFKVRIGPQDAIVLYAQAPRAAHTCDEYTGTTTVGWVHTRLIAVK